MYLCCQVVKKLNFGKRLLEYLMPTTDAEMLHYIAILIGYVFCFLSLCIYKGNVSPVLLLPIFVLLNAIMLLVYFRINGGVKN